MRWVVAVVVAGLAFLVVALAARQQRLLGLEHFPVILVRVAQFQQQEQADRVAPPLHHKAHLHPVLEEVEEQVALLVLQVQLAPVLP